MKKEEFIKESLETIKKCMEVFEEKHSEYSDHGGNEDGDCFYSFKNVSKLLNEKPEKIAFMYMMKHFQSLVDIIYNEHFVSEETFDEKIRDLINYILIINGIVKESINKKYSDL